MRSRHALVKLLAPYGCRLVRQIEPGFELWETGWGEPFKLFPEGGGYYGEQQLPRIRAVISSTMPTDWKTRPPKLELQTTRSESGGGDLGLIAGTGCSEEHAPGLIYKATSKIGSDIE